MNKLYNLIYTYFLCILAVLLSTNSAVAITQITCDNFQYDLDLKIEANKIIDTLENMSFVDKINSDSLIDYLYCLSTRTEDVLIRPRALMLLGEKYFEKSDFTNSKKAFNEIVQMKKELVSPYLLAGVHNYLAIILEMEGKSLTAYKHNLAQLELSKEHKLLFLSRAYLNLGQFHFKTMKRQNLCT